MLMASNKQARYANRTAAKQPLHPKSVFMPRRTRRGAGMIEVTLGFFVTATVIAGLLEFTTANRLDELNQASAREVSLVADAAEAFALTNFDIVDSLIAAEDDGIAEIDPAALSAAGFLGTDEPITAFKDPIAILYVSDDPGVITAFAVARRVRSNSYTIPRPEDGIRAVGVNPRFRGGTVIGYGLEARIQNGNRSLVTDAGVSNGSLVGVRTVSFANDIDPFLHRIAIPGRPELNQMETDLDMAGRSITGVRDFQSATATVNNLDVSNALSSVSTTIGGALTVNGDMTVTGTLSGGTGDFSRRLDASSLNITGELRASSVVTQALSASNATFTQSLSTASISSAVITTDALTTDQFSAANVTIQALTTDTLTIANELNAGTGFINQITTESCQGC